MTRIFFLCIGLFQFTFVFGQTFQLSNDYDLTELSWEEIQNLFKQEDFDGFGSIYIVDKNGGQLQEIKVYAEHYVNELVVEESEVINLAGVQKVIKVEVPECYCYCDSSVYYWVITENGEWIPLPIVIDQYETTLAHREYVFPTYESNLIFLYEFQDEFIDKGDQSSNQIKRKSEKILAKFKWDGEEIIEF